MQTLNFVAFTITTVWISLYLRTYTNQRRVLNSYHGDNESIVP